MKNQIAVRSFVISAFEVVPVIVSRSGRTAKAPLPPWLITLMRLRHPVRRLPELGINPMVSDRPQKEWPRAVQLETNS